MGIGIRVASCLNHHFKELWWNLQSEHNGSSRVICSEGDDMVKDAYEISIWPCQSHSWCLFLGKLTTSASPLKMMEPVRASWNLQSKNEFPNRSYSQTPIDREMKREERSEKHGTSSIILKLLPGMDCREGRLHTAPTLCDRRAITCTVVHTLMTAQIRFVDICSANRWPGKSHSERNELQRHFL